MRRCVWPRLNDCWEKNYETDKRDGDRCARCGGGGHGNWLLVGGGGGQRTEDSICCATNPPARFCITAIRWACRIPHRYPKKTRWAWTMFRCTKEGGNRTAIKPLRPSLPQEPRDR